MTLVGQSDTVIPAVVDEGASVFSPDELTRLVYLIIEINAWTRLAITLGTAEPSSYSPKESLPVGEQPVFRTST